MPPYIVCNDEIAFLGQAATGRWPRGWCSWPLDFALGAGVALDVILMD